jgi:hypothetical protein
MEVKIPFAYISDIKNTFDTAAASSSAFPSFSYDLTPYGLAASGSLFSLEKGPEKINSSTCMILSFVLSSSLRLIYGRPYPTS